MNFSIILYVIVFTFISLLEKYAADKHHIISLSLSRMFYILVITIIFIIILEPNVLSTKTFHQSMKDPGIIVLGVLTAIGTFLYFWILTFKNLYEVTIVWPIIMILTIIASCLIIKEKINFKQWLGIVLTFIGVLITLSYKSK